MGTVLSFLFPDTTPCLKDEEIYEYDPSAFFSDAVTESCIQDIVMIHPSIPRLSWIKAVKEGDQAPESYLRVIPLSVYTFRADPTLDPEITDLLHDLGDTAIEENRLYILVPDFRPSILETWGLWFLSPWTYSREQVLHSLTCAYERMLNAALDTTYTRIRFPPFSVDLAGPWSKRGEAVDTPEKSQDSQLVNGNELKSDELQPGESETNEMASLTAQALATACSRERLALMYEHGKAFEIVLSLEEEELYTKMIKALT